MIFINLSLILYNKIIVFQPSWVESPTSSSRHEPPIIPPEVIENVTNIRDVLLMLVEEDHLVWAPVVLHWSYKLLGKFLEITDTETIF